jgi:hypothetical protein
MGTQPALKLPCKRDGQQANKLIGMKRSAAAAAHTLSFCVSRLVGWSMPKCSELYLHAALSQQSLSPELLSVPLQ